MSEIKKDLNKFGLIGLTVLTVSLLLLFVIATNYFIFPSKYKIPFLASIFVLVCINAALVFFSDGWFKKFSNVMIVLECLLIVCALILLPNIESRVRNIFNNIKTDEAVINVYVLNENYREDFSAYKYYKFITQTRSDLENQEYAIEKIYEELGVSVINQLQKSDIMEAVEALYEGKGDLLILNEAYVPLIEEMEGYSNFEEDCKVVYTINRQIDIEPEPVIEEPKEITEKMFTVYVAGCDTRSGRLSTYGRTDVNLLVNVNPVTKQILIVGLPRDAYIPNPAISYGYDKLTHLGNDGIQNTMKGVSEYMDVQIDYYGEVIFDTFKRIVDALGGIDVENPYYFNTYGGNGGMNGENFEFPEGTIHLYGNAALGYCRERYNLPNGDYGRNEHQTIALKAVIKKLMSTEVISNYNEILEALNGQFLTDIAVDDIYKLIAMQIDDNSSWDIITYHLGGEGKMQGTASMGYDRYLYTVNLFDSQVKFVKEQIDLMSNNEKIVQGSLPNDADTTYIPN